jgi:hypothetical protein
MKKIKTIALLALAMLEALIPVAILLYTAYVDNFRTFGWAVHIALSLVMLAFGGFVLLTARKDKKEMIEGMTGLAIAGCLSLLLTVGMIAIFNSREPWCQKLPTELFTWYLFCAFTGLLWYMGEWRKIGGVKCFIFWCVFVLIANIATFGTINGICAMFGVSVPEFIQTIAGFIIGVCFFLGIGRLGVNAVNMASDKGLDLSARLFHACCAMFCGGFCSMLGYCALMGMGLRLPTVVENACFWLMGSAFIGIILSLMVLVIEIYLDNRKA